MGYQKVFKRFELKYLISREQMGRILEAMEPYMEIDKYGESTIRNVYFDSDDNILARRSIQKPDFKEKIRVRSYAQAGHGSMVFVELKRKYDHVVYKRRIGMPEQQAMDWITGKALLPESGEGGNELQVRREIEYFLGYYRALRPAMFISYDRKAYRAKKVADSGFRITFDENILCRDYDMSLTAEVYGSRIIPEDKVLMEVKCSGGMPIWLVRVLSEEKIYKTSFSKYGTAYTRKELYGSLDEEAMRDGEFVNKYIRKRNHVVGQRSADRGGAGNVAAAWARDRAHIYA